MMIRVTKMNDGTFRCHIFGKRVHHGFLGIIATFFGVAACLHDRKDARIWFKFNI